MKGFPKVLLSGMATSTRGACHMRSRPSLDILGLPEEVLKKIYGGPVSSDQFSSYSGKGRMVWWHEIFNAVSDALGSAISSRSFQALMVFSTGNSQTDCPFHWSRPFAERIKTIGERIYTLKD